MGTQCHRHLARPSSAPAANRHRAAMRIEVLAADLAGLFTMKTNLLELSDGSLVEYKEGMDLGTKPKSASDAEIVRCILEQQVILAKKHAGIAPGWMTTALEHARKAAGKA